MYVDNVLVPARLLENGRTIQQISDFDMVEYFHLEFDEAQIILTNGTPSESYVDSGNRRMFENYGEYFEMYGEPEREIQPARRCYTVYSGNALAAIKRRLGGNIPASG